MAINAKLRMIRTIKSVNYDYNMDVNNEKCLFASDRQTLTRVPKDTIDRFMRSREAMPVDDLINI